MTNYRVVIVDDNWEICELFKVILQNLEIFVVESFDRGKSFISYLSDENTIDVAIIDLDLPDISGFEIIKILRESKYKFLPIIVISAFDDFNHKIKALEIGADDYIVKPINIFEVVIKINNILKRQKYISELGKREGIIEEKAEIINLMKTFLKDHVYAPANDFKNKIDEIIKQYKGAKVNTSEVKSNLTKLSSVFNGIMNTYNNLLNDLAPRIEKLEKQREELVNGSEIEEQFKTAFRKELGN